MYDLFGNPVISQKCSVTVQNGGLLVVTPYNPQFVTLIKSLPANARQFNRDAKAWLVDTQYSKQIRQWILNCYDEDIENIGNTTVQPKLEIRVCDVWYLGRTKPNGDERMASGMDRQKNWSYLFSERVLKEWFEGLSDETISAVTLYGILGIRRTATPDEIRSAYRRMAKQWHPDICKEPNAPEMFIKIKEACDLLSDEIKRAKYDAGLALESSLGTSAPNSNGYRSPLRCGYVLAEGFEQLGRFVVQKILDWQDITSEKGALVASWQMGASEPVWQWV